MKGSGCKIYYSIALICYLEAVLWTTLLLSGCVAVSIGPEGSSYLHRETSNQGQAGFNLHPTELGANVNHLVLKAYNLHQQLERLSLRKISQSCAVTECPGKSGARGDLRLVPALKGVPAPFTGIQAIL